MRNLKKPLFILAGNGPYDNRGCEAIVRGTVNIIRNYFENPHFIVLSHFQNNKQFKDQVKSETDNFIQHLKATRPYRRFDITWWLERGIRLFFPRAKKYLTYMSIITYFKDSLAVLSIGGDNYSLDYGIPTLFIELDDLVLKYKKPLIIWGASVGPFNENPMFETFMAKHLNKVTGIFARETISMYYLEQIGVQNVFKVADPAFLLEARVPTREKLNYKIENGIGVNLSPLMANYATNGDLNKWLTISTELIINILANTNNNIYLIPHVTSPHSNDYLFLSKIFEMVKILDPDRVKLLPSNLNAAETKWVISKMDVFMGARTHSIISALSSYVPTLSLAYSIKAVGINIDIFGDTKYSINIQKYDEMVITKKLKHMIKNKNDISTLIKSKMSIIKEDAMKAGYYLKNIVNGENT